jgi:hypothetical protein
LEEGIDIDIDGLTNSIENAVTGDRFQTETSLLEKNDLRIITKKRNWVFDWSKEFRNPDTEIYKLTIVGNPGIIQGVVSIENKPDHIYMRLIENAPFNKSKSKMYIGVPGNLVAFVCRLSLQRGHEGNVSFRSKSQLVPHYAETLGAVHVGGRNMIIDSVAAKKLIDKYYKW